LNKASDSAMGCLPQFTARQHASSDCLNNLAHDSAFQELLVRNSHRTRAAVTKTNQREGRQWPAMVSRPRRPRKSAHFAFASVMQNVILIVHGPFNRVGANATGHRT